MGPPTRAIELDHRAFDLLGGPQQSLCVAYAEEGAFTLIDLDSGRTVTVTGLTKIRDIYPHPLQPLLALIDDGKLSVIDYHGSHLLEWKPPRLRKRSPSWLRPGFDSCYFDAYGDYLWSLARLSADKVEIQVRDTERWSVVGSAAVTDPFKGSHCSLYATSQPDVAVLWLAAGQNGQQVCWVTKLADSLDIEPEAYLEDTNPPVFAPKGDEFLVVDDLSSISKYPFPADQILGMCRSKWGEADYFGGGLCYLDNANALVLSHHSRLYRLDLRSMKIRDEVAVPGHEARPAEEYYPPLVGDKTLCTDIAFLTRLGRAVVLGFHRESGADLRKWKDTLLIYDVDSIARERTGARGPEAPPPVAASSRPPPLDPTRGKGDHTASVPSSRRRTMRRTILLLAGVLLSVVALGSDSPKEYDDKKEVLALKGHGG